MVVFLVVGMFTTFTRSSAPLTDKLRRLAIVFFLTVFGVNHITNANSKCILTTLENTARIKENKTEVGDFLPRYYETIKGWF